MDTHGTQINMYFIQLSCAISPQIQQTLPTKKWNWQKQWLERSLVLVLSIAIPAHLFMEMYSFALSLQAFRAVLQFSRLARVQRQVSPPLGITISGFSQFNGFTRRSCGIDSCWFRRSPLSMRVNPGDRFPQQSSVSTGHNFSSRKYATP